jgi:hypothetical protein
MPTKAHEASLAAKPGGAYALYFPDGGEVELDLRGPAGSFAVCSIDIATGEWGRRDTLAGGEWIPLAVPGPGHWAAAVGKSPWLSSAPI